MTKTDTVVGILGACILAAAMIGVFVYEYNNAPPVGPSPDSDEGKRLSFGTAYPTLNATGDLDGDQKPNYLDDDLDGDGAANARDNETAYSKGIRGNVPQQPLPGQTASSPPFTTQAEAGATKLVFTMTYQTTQPNPLAPRVPNLVLTVQTPAGDNRSCDSQPVTGSVATCTVTIEDAEPGAYTGTVTSPGPTQGGNFDVAYVVSY